MVHKSTIIKSDEELIEKFHEYVAWANEREKPIMMQSFIVWMGRSHSYLFDAKHRLSESIKRIKQVCEVYTAEQLYDRSRKNLSGIIFSLKNNFWRVDKVETKNENSNTHTLTIEPTVYTDGTNDWDDE